jgi:hypothetical protein
MMLTVASQHLRYVLALCVLSMAAVSAADHQYESLSGSNREQIYMYLQDLSQVPQQDTKISLSGFESLVWRVGIVAVNSHSVALFIDNAESHGLSTKQIDTSRGKNKSPSCQKVYFGALIACLLLSITSGGIWTLMSPLTDIANNTVVSTANHHFLYVNPPGHLRALPHKGMIKTLLSKRRNRAASQIRTSLPSLDHLPRGLPWVDDTPSKAIHLLGSVPVAVSNLHQFLFKEHPFCVGCATTFSTWVWMWPGKVEEERALMHTTPQGKFCVKPHTYICIWIYFTEGY